MYELQSEGFEIRNFHRFFKRFCVGKIEFTITFRDFSVVYQHFAAFWTPIWQLDLEVWMVLEVTQNAWFWSLFATFFALEISYYPLRLVDCLKNNSKTISPNIAAFWTPIWQLDLGVWMVLEVIQNAWFWALLAAFFALENSNYRLRLVDILKNKSKTISPKGTITSRHLYTGRWFFEQFMCHVKKHDFGGKRSLIVI